MKIIQLEQRTPEWTKWRTEGVGGSDIAAICGVSPYKTALDVYREKIGEYEQPMTAPMQRGVEYEAEALQVFTRSLNKGYENSAPIFVPLLCEHDEEPWCHASLDGFYHFKKELVEIKIPSLKVLEMARYRQIPLHYEYQIQWQLFVSGASMAHYFCYHPESLVSYRVHVFHNDDLIDKMYEKAKEFWQRVIDRKPPTIYKRCSQDAAAILDKMMQLKKTQNQAEAEYKLNLATLLELEGEDNDLEADQAILSKASRATIDYKQACIDAKLDIENYKKEKNFYWTIREKK